MVSYKFQLSYLKEFQIIIFFQKHVFSNGQINLTCKRLTGFLSGLNYYETRFKLRTVQSKLCWTCLVLRKFIKYVLAVVRPTKVYLLDLFCCSIQFYVLLSPCLYFISFLYLYLYVLGDGVLISYRDLSCKPNIYVYWSTCELRTRLARREPLVKYLYWPVQGGTSFVDHLCYFCLVLVMLSCASVYWWLVVTCWQRADLMALVCDT